MSANLTNSNITAIAFKRLSGKAMTSGKFSLPEESLGSFVQTTNQTLFADTFPLEPSSQSAALHLIQSASDGAAGSVMYVEFDLEVLPNTEYNNNTQVDTNPNLAEQGVTNRDLGDTTLDVTTFHAYQIKLKSDFCESVQAVQDFDTHASTTTTFGTSQFTSSFAATGSTQLQIVPEYVTTVNVNNPYVPSLIDKQGTVLEGTDGIDYYVDTAAGIVFVQDPVDVYTANAAQVPDKLRAFLYVGKYQSEIEGGNFHISGSEGGGFSIVGQVTASFETGSGDGLTITADPNANSLTFQLNDVVSGSAGLIHISASSNNGADLGAQQTASFIDGGAGLTVRRNTIAGGQEIVIGTVNDDVEFNNGTFNGNVTVEGDVIAQNYIVSSSVTYMTQSFSSGSTIFGDTVGGANADTHQFTGSIFVTGSTFTWDGLGSSDGTTPLVIDENGNITSGPAFSAATGIHLSASGDEGFTLQSSDTASFKSDNAQLVIDATAASNEILFTVGGGVVSGSDQILDGSGILSSSTQDFAAYSSSVETLISDATASIEVNETNITALQASASAGIYFSASVGGGTSIALTETASFIGGDGITVTNSNGEITIESDYGELDSALHISASDGNGTSIAYTATASFSASGPGLTATLDGSEINYDINANTLIEAVDTATVINITASYAESASVATSASYALSSSYAVTASYAENAGSVSVTEDTATNNLQTVIFSSLLDNDAIDNGDVNEDVTLKAHNAFSVDTGRRYLYVSGGDGYNRIEQKAIQSSGSIGTPFNLLTAAGNPNTINMGISTGTVYFKGSASIAGDLIVQGTTTTLNTENLLVEDKYILLASGSGGNSDGGGIIVRRSSNTSGTALHWDESNAVWAIDFENADPSASPSVGTDLAVVAVQKASGNPSGNPILGGSTDYRYGQMYINTTDTDGDGNQIWIYAP